MKLALGAPLCALCLAGCAVAARPAAARRAAAARELPGTREGPRVMAAVGHRAAGAAAAAPTKPAASLSKADKEKAAQSALPQLQSIMARAQSSLARAEKHHERAVQKARAAVGDLFQEQARLMGAEVARYAADLDQAARQLSAVINASKAELAAEEQAEAKNSSVGWGGAAMEERARAGAKADAALRELRHLERKRGRDVEEATRRALEPLDDATLKLSRRVGDLSPVSDEAKASLEWAAKKGGVGASIMNMLNITKDAKGVEKVLEAARNVTAQKIKSADAAFAAALANNTNITQAGVKKIEQGLVEAEKEEIKRVRR